MRGDRSETLAQVILLTMIFPSTDATSVTHETADMYQGKGKAIQNAGQHPKK